MKILKPWQQLREQQSLKPVLRRVTVELSEQLNRAVILQRAKHSGGFDAIYLAFPAEDTLRVHSATCNSDRRGSHRSPVAVLRIRNPLAPRRPVNPALPRNQLPFDQRISREHRQYQLLAPLGICPAPMGFGTDFLANEYFPGTRLSHLLKLNTADPLHLLKSAFSAVVRMHEAGVVHLDLNCGNILVHDSPTPTDAASHCCIHRDIRLIDFEYSLPPELSQAQAQALDWLRLIHDLMKPRRARSLLTSDHDVLLRILPRSLPHSVRNADLPFAATAAGRIYSSPIVLQQLRTVFRQLPPQATHRGLSSSPVQRLLSSVTGVLRRRSAVTGAGIPSET